MAAQGINAVNGISVRTPLADGGRSYVIRPVYLGKVSVRIFRAQETVSLEDYFGWFVQKIFWKHVVESRCPHQYADV